MGGAVSTFFAQTRESIKDYNDSIFIDQVLINGQHMMAHNIELRKSFIEFIKTGTWIDRIEHYENNKLESNAERPDDSVWAKFGYVVPAEKNIRGSGTRSSFASDLSWPANSTSNLAEITNTHHESIREMYHDLANATTFTRSELRAVLLAAVFPFFLSSPEYKTIHGRKRISMTHYLESHNCSVPEHDEDAADDGGDSAVDKSERLRELLLGAAAYFDETELLESLAHEQWLHEFQSAMETMPLNVTISQVDELRKSAPIVFASTGLPRPEPPSPPQQGRRVSASPFRSSLSMIASPLRSSTVSLAASSSGSGKMISWQGGGGGGGGVDAATAAANAVAATGLTPEAAAVPSRPVLTQEEKIGQSILSGNFYGDLSNCAQREALEKAVLEAGTLKGALKISETEVPLVAIRPIHGPDGTYNYALNIDFPHFTDAKTADELQIVDDMLALIPLLVKCPTKKAAARAAHVEKQKSQQQMVQDHKQQQHQEQKEGSSSPNGNTRNRNELSLDTGKSRNDSSSGSGSGGGGGGSTGSKNNNNDGSFVRGTQRSFMSTARSEQLDPPARQEVLMSDNDVVSIVRNFAE